MDERLKGIQAKFDVVQERFSKMKLCEGYDETYVEIIVHTLGSMIKATQRFRPFEEWYDQQGKHFLEIANKNVREENLEITKGELSLLYDHFREIYPKL